MIVSFPRIASLDSEKEFMRTRKWEEREREMIRKEKEGESVGKDKGSRDSCEGGDMMQKEARSAVIRVQVERDIMVEVDSRGQTRVV